MKLNLLINVKMPTIVGFLTFISRMNTTSESFKHMGQYQLLSVLAAQLSPLNIDHSGNLPVEICGINYTEKYTNL